MQEDPVVLRADELWRISSEKWVIGAEILRCKKLEVLDLRGHYYDWPVRLPEELGSLKNLSVIILEWCQGLEKLPKSLGQLDKLEYLRLFRCGELFGRSKCVLNESFSEASTSHVLIVLMSISAPQFVLFVAMDIHKFYDLNGC
jgi:hypothetical protein